MDDKEKRKRIDDLIKQAKFHIANLDKAFKDLKDSGVIGFCKHCGLEKYKDKIHKCNIEV